MLVGCAVCVGYVIDRTSVTMVDDEYDYYLLDNRSTLRSNNFVIYVLHVRMEPELCNTLHETTSLPIFDNNVIAAQTYSGLKNACYRQLKFRAELKN